MKRRGLFAFGVALVAALTVVGSVAAAVSAPIFNSANAPNGTHVQTGAPSCSISGTTVTCVSYELAGVGGANATANLDLNYSATVQCRNNGGKIVPVKSQVTGASANTGQLEPKNGRLEVPALSSASTSLPSDDAFEANATCPNGNWTKETLASSVALTSFTYTLTFTGFPGAYITITGSS